MRSLPALAFVGLLAFGQAHAQQAANLNCKQSATGPFVPAGECGTPGTGISQPTGGYGPSGWLSGIYSNTSQILSALTTGAGIIISGTVTAAQGTASTTQSWLTNVNRIGGTLLTLGQKAMLSSLPVVIASDQSAVPVALNATPSLANGNGVVPTQTGAVLSATNGGFQNVLQGNVALSATNGLYSNQLQGNAVLSATNGAYTNVLQGNAALSVTNPLPASISPLTSGGLLNKRLQVAANTTSVAIKASAGQLYGIEAFNNAATIAYVKLYDAAQGSTTCGSGTPVYQGMIPATSASTGAGYVSMNTFGLTFATAITVCVTTGFADNDSTNPAATTYVANFFYK